MVVEWNRREVKQLKYGTVWHHGCQRRGHVHESGGTQMNTITVKDGTTIYYKDWGPKNAQPIVFHHGWPLSADDWDAQMLYFVEREYRVIAHDRDRKSVV